MIKNITLILLVSVAGLKAMDSQRAAVAAAVDTTQTASESGAAQAASGNSEVMPRMLGGEAAVFEACNKIIGFALDSYRQREHCRAQSEQFLYEQRLAEQHNIIDSLEKSNAQRAAAQTEIIRLCEDRRATQEIREQRECAFLSYLHQIVVDVVQGKVTQPSSETVSDISDGQLDELKKNIQTIMTRYFSSLTHPFSRSYNPLFVRKITAQQAVIDSSDVTDDQRAAAHEEKKRLAELYQQYKVVCAVLESARQQSISFDPSTSLNPQHIEALIKEMYQEASSELKELIVRLYERRMAAKEAMIAQLAAQLSPANQVPAHINDFNRQVQQFRRFLDGLFAQGYQAFLQMPINQSK